MKRESGKTFRLCLMAHAKASEGQHVVIVVLSQAHAQHIRHMLGRILGAIDAGTQINRTHDCPVRYRAIFGGGKIQLVHKSNLDNATRGQRIESIMRDNYNEYC